MAVNLVNRVQKILLSPASEWSVIDGEPADTTGIMTTYVAPLVVLAAVAGFLGSWLFRPTIAGLPTIGPSMTSLLIIMLVGIAISLVMVYVFAFIIDALAPSFASQKNFGQAFKVSAYSGTAQWVGGIFSIIPIVGWIIALAGLIYSLVLVFMGLPKLMKSPADKGVVYTIVCIVISIVLYLVVGYIEGRLVLSLMMGGMGTGVPGMPG